MYIHQEYNIIKIGGIYMSIFKRKKKINKGGDLKNMSDADKIVFTHNCAARI